MSLALNKATPSTNVIQKQIRHNVGSNDEQNLVHSVVNMMDMMKSLFTTLESN